jgi:DNA-binding NtrC family response regulator
MLSVLFVDDEPNFTAALKRTLQGRQDGWSMRFATSGTEALEMLKARPANAVVSDMEMPGMSGAELLERVKRDYPETILIVLSGQCDRPTALKTVDAAHIHLSKPCNTIELVNAITRACRLQNFLVGSHGRRSGQGNTSISASPIYSDLVRALRDPDVETETVAELIERDANLTTRLLKLINTAFDGACWSAKSPLQTINLLGLDLIRSLILDIPGSGRG